MKETAEIKRLERKLTTDMLWIYLLAILKKQPMHAYALRAEIHKKFGFKPGNVSAYVVLYKLESRGYVSSSDSENRRIYKITKKGIELLKEAKQTFSNLEKSIF
jgi:DNA-binding PadR family transcriptional regulator